MDRADEPDRRSAGQQRRPGWPQLGNSRPLYWSEGLKVGEHALLAGVGAGGFDTARTRYSSSTLDVAHAHSFVIETFADFGLIGLAVRFALLGAWAVAVGRTLGIGPGRPARQSAGAADRLSVANGAGAADSSPSGNGAGNARHAHAPIAGVAAEPADAPHRAGDARVALSPYAAERAGLITMLAVVVIFGVSSLIDWTWFIPGVAVPALVCAGWLAGRGPLSAPVGRAKHPPAPARASPGAAAGAIGIVAATLVAAWFVWQPLHSANEFDAAITAMQRGDSAAALADAHSAAASDPVSVDPLWELSVIYRARGDPTAARQELVKATTVQPSNPQTWQALGTFDLDHHQANLALLELQTAQQLDLQLDLARPADRPGAARAVAVSPEHGFQRTARASSIRLSSGGPSTARTSTSPNPNSSSREPSEPPRVQMQMISERLREPLDAAERDPQPAVRGRGHEQPPAAARAPV